MDKTIYKEMRDQFVKSANQFDGVSTEDVTELVEDFDTILETIDITKHSGNYDGVIKSTPDLIAELKVANSQNDKQGCIESIAMIRASLMNVESSLSNAADSLEKLIISIRDA